MKYYLFYKKFYQRDWNSQEIKKEAIKAWMSWCKVNQVKMQLNIIDNKQNVTRFTTPNEVLNYLEDFYDRKYNINLDMSNHSDTSNTQSNLVDTNLKTAAAVGKPKLSDVPTVALFAMGAAMSDGASKYGRYNWRDTGTTASVFYDAMHRHLNDWYSGEDHAHDSKIHHLAHLMASCAILLDSMRHGNFNDDRNTIGAVSRSPELWKNTK